MDEQLAAIYGTGGAASENDLEKTAAAELLLKIAEAEGVDLNQFSDAQVMAMVHDLTKTASENEEDEQEKESEGDDSEEKEKESEGDSEKEEESEEKVAEADFLGRVMAHAYVQELNNIEKQAGIKDVAQKVWSATKGKAGKVGKYFTDAKDQAAAGARTLKGGWKGRAAVAGEGAMDAAARKTVSKAMMREGSKELAKGVGKIALPVAGAGALGAGAYALGKKKESSALDTLAEQRALEMLAEAGYAQEKTASAVEVAVEQRALEMLEASGYPVEWNR